VWNTWYAIHDYDRLSNPSCLDIDPVKAGEMNRQGFGIYWAVNLFHGARRRENLDRILAWYVDIDSGSKEEQMARLQRSPLAPTLVIETKNGYHAYWKAKDATPESWDDIVRHRLVPFYGADERARDVCRIMRVPGYLHQKDPADPFLVKVVWFWDVGYREHEIAQAYPLNADGLSMGPRPTMQVETYASDGFWEAVFRLDCAKGLRRLSGHPAVNGERYELRPTTRGNQNVYVNGRCSSCWIDNQGRIGSLSRGGPSLYQWLRWFGNSPRRCAEVLKEVFPELAEVGQ